MNLSSQPNATMTKFGYPESLICDYRRWVVLLRPHQTTLGALVLVCKDPVEAFGDISAEAFAELQEVTGDIEAGLGAFRPYQKINYLMLMMVDKHVHFHVIPRYASERQATGVTFVDRHWPKPPLITDSQDLSDDQLQALTELLRGAWSGGG